MDQYYINIPKNNAFEAFEKKDNTAELRKYYLKPDSDTDKFIPEKKLKNSKQKNKKNKKSIKDMVILGFGASSLMLAGAFLFLTTGSSNKLFKNIGSSFKKLKYAAVDKDTHFMFEKALNKAYNGVNKFLNISANFTPIKDTIFKKFMFSLPDNIGRKPWQKITDIYSNINVSTTRRTLTDSNDKVNRVLDWINFNGEKLPEDSRKQLVELSKSLHRTKSDYFKGFDSRVDKMHKSMHDMRERLSIKDIFLKMKEGLVTDSLLEEKSAISGYFTPIEESIETMTNNIPQLCKGLSEQINQSKDLMYKIKNKKLRLDVRDYLKTLTKELDVYKKMDNIGRDEKAKQIRDLICDYQSFLKENNQAELLSASDNLLKAFDEIPNKKGIIEEMRILIRDSELSEQDKLSFKTVCNNARDSLYDSLKSEHNMFDKDREIVVGNGPTDVLSLLAPFALLGGQLASNKTKDEKIGITLEAGAPIIGSVATYLYAMARQLSGVAALVTSFGTGAVLNLVGSAIFKTYQNHSNKNSQINAAKLNTNNNTEKKEETKVSK